MQSSQLTDGDDRNHVAWITCGDSLEDDFLVLGDAFGIPKSIGKEKAFNAVLKALKGIEGRLYLFLDDLSRDSANKDLETLNALRPNVHVMITSRRQIKGIPHLELHELNDGSAIDMFYDYYERDKERKYLEDARRINNAESVKRHTLLVELLAKAANRSFDTLDVFRGELEEKGFFEVSKARLNTAHDENLTIEESVIKLYEISGLTPEQRRIMSLFSIFTPEKVIYGKVVEWAGFDENDVEDLVQLAWLVRTEDGYVIHQIVRDSLARQVGISLKIEEYGSLLKMVAETKSYMQAHLGYTKVRERLTLAEDLVRYIDIRIGGVFSTGGYVEGDVEFLRISADLLHNIGEVHYEQGEYKKALEYYTKALNVRAHVLGNDDPDTAFTLNNMGLVYHAQGKFKKALVYFEKSLEIRTKVLTNDHLDTAATYNNIARVYRMLGKYKKALEYYEKDSEISERLLKGNHPDKAITYNNMAGVFYELGDYEKALDFFNEALRIYAQTLEPNDPNIAIAYNNIAYVYLAQKDYTKVQEYSNKALSIFEHVLGVNHPNTATTYNNLGEMYHAQGNYSMAQEYYNKARIIREQELEDRHPETAMTYYCMASVYKDTGDYKNALYYYERSLSIFKERFGKTHKYTKNALKDIESIRDTIEDIAQV